MVINNKFVHFKMSAKFKEQLEAGNIKDTSVCFIKDTNQIYTHGQYYDCSELTDEKVVSSSLVGYAESQETNEALDLSSSDTIISAFGKLVKAIKDNEEVESAAFVKLRDSIGLDENLNYETGGGSSISEDISDLKNSVGSLNDNSVGKFYHIDDTKTGEIFNDYENNIAGNNAHAEGYTCTASGDYSHAECYKNKVSGYSSHGEGYMNEVSSGAGHVEGRENIVTGDIAHAEGYATKAKGYGSHSENGGGVSIYLTGDAGATQYKVVKTHGLLSNLLPSELYEYINFEDLRIVNNDDFSLIDIVSSSYDEINDEITITLSNTLSYNSPISDKLFGLVVNVAAGDYSHTEGNCYCNSTKGHAEGIFNVIASNSDASHVEGALNIAKAEQCHVEGALNVASNNYEHAQGFYNLSNTGDTDDKKTLHSVGIGAKGARKNAHEIMRNGDQYIIGVGGYDGTNPETAKTIQEIINSGGSESNYVLFNLEDLFTNEYKAADLKTVIFSNTSEKLSSSTTNEINIENVRKLLDAYNNNKIILLKMTYAAQKTCVVQCQLSYYDSPFGKQLLLNFGSNVYPSVNDDGSIVDHKISILFRFDRINSLQNEAYYRGISLELNSKGDMGTSVLTGEGFYRYLGEIILNEYSKITSYSALSPNDSLQKMIGKLDAKYGNKEDGGTGEIVKTLSPNVFYQFGEVTSLTLTLGNEISGIYNEYMFQFTCGATPATLGLPDDIKWLNGEAPTIEANKTYQVSIVNKLAVIGGF